MLSEACVLGRTLVERGHAVFFARCFRLFERCPVMDMHRLPYDAGPEQKLETCLKCADNSLSMLADYGLDAIDLRGIVVPEMLRRIDDALPPASADLFNFEFDGQPFGQILSGRRGARAKDRRIQWTEPSGSFGVAAVCAQFTRQLLDG